MPESSVTLHHLATGAYSPPLYWNSHWIEFLGKAGTPTSNTKFIPLGPPACSKVLRICLGMHATFWAIDVVNHHTMYIVWFIVQCTSYDDSFCSQLLHHYLYEFNPTKIWTHFLWNQVWASRWNTHALHIHFSVHFGDSFFGFTWNF